MFLLYRVIDLLSPFCSEYQQDDYYETYENVYEAVGDINKFIMGQNSRKRKAGLKSKNVH